MQRAVDTTIEEDVFSMVAPRDYVSGTEPNQGFVEWERERAPAVKEEGFGRRLTVNYFNWLWARDIALEDVNKSSHPIRNPLLLVTEPRTRESIFN
jgi:hypothetical protein